MLNENSIADFKANLRGRLIVPGDADYDEARKVYNGMIHKKPRLIARCADVADVIRSVNFGRDNNLLVSIRGGGHNAGSQFAMTVSDRPSADKYTQSIPRPHGHSRWRSAGATSIMLRTRSTATPRESFPPLASAD
jgi:hypothetical protein